MREALTPNTVLVVGSAPNYPVRHHRPDPGDRGDGRGARHPLPRRRLPRRLPAAVLWSGWATTCRRGTSGCPASRSISADCHKYGYAARGASTIMYRDPKYRRYQFFAVTDWPGGLYGSPTMTGSRPGGAIAAAWAVLNYLGEAGYLASPKIAMDTTRKLQDGIRAIDWPAGPRRARRAVFAVGSDDFDIHAVGDALASAAGTRTASKCRRACTSWSRPPTRRSSSRSCRPARGRLRRWQTEGGVPSGVGGLRGARQDAGPGHGARRHPRLHGRPDARAGSGAVTAADVRGRSLVSRLWSRTLDRSSRRAVSSLRRRLARSSATICLAKLSAAEHRRCGVCWHRAEARCAVTAIATSGVHGAPLGVHLRRAGARRSCTRSSSMASRRSRR